MRHWSPWDRQLLRVLRGEFRHTAPTLRFEQGPDGGVVVFHECTRIGLWVASGQLVYRYLPAAGRATDDPCEIMDIIDLSRTLFSPFLAPAHRSTI